MLRITSFVFAYATLLLFAGVAGAQSFEHPVRDDSAVRASPNGMVAQTIGTARFSISYSRPLVKGRTVFGDLEPFGKVWRSGANEATTIVVPVDVTVEGQPLAAGVYSLFTVPGESEWTVVFNSVAKQWGAFKHDPEQDVLRVTVDSREAPHQEILTYSFEDVTADAGTIVLHWGTTAVPFRVEIGG